MGWHRRTCRASRRNISIRESMVVIAVGDRTRIEAELKKLNLGPVEIVP